jgi:DNA-binding MarR family transcriptional regulator
MSVHDPPDLSVALENALSPLLFLVARASSTALQHLSTSQSQSLLVLESRGPLRLTTFAAAMAVLPSSATRLCDRLVAAGLVERTGHDADRREVMIALTRQGQRTAGQLRQRRVEVLQGALANLDVEQRADLLRGLSALSSGLDDAELDPLS